MTMGLLDSVIGALGQAQGKAGGAGAAGGLGDLLGGLGGGAGGGASGAAGAGGQADLLAGVIGMLGAGGQGGGLAALVQKFQQAGLGDVVASWIASGPNKPISGEQLGQVLGSDALGGVAQQAGMNGNELMGQLAQLLPVLVDQLTPDGKLPDAGQLSSGGMENLANLLGGSLKR
jgi:uncharacterized protein YidB (DUF937 family)